MVQTATRTCSKCNAAVPEGHTHCGQCGTRYEGTNAQDKQTLLFGALMAAGRAKLVLIKGGDGGFPGESWHLNAKQHPTGRRQGVVLFPGDPLLSPRHCDFFYRDNALFVRDEGSLNGVYVRLKGATEIKPNDQIMIGEQVLQVEALDIPSEFPMRDGTLMYVSPPRPFRFRVIQLLEGGRPGQIYASPHNEVIVGREGCDMNFPEDRHTSRRHAKIALEGAKLTVTDLGSANGTFLRIRGEHSLGHGDYVQIGQELLRVEIT